MTNYKKARAEAIKRKVSLLMVFSISDLHSSACARLDAELLKRRAFQEEAGKKYVLFYADYPRGIRQTQDIADQNKSLASRYSVYKYPTILLVDPSSERVLVKESDFAPGMNPKKFLAVLEAAKRKNSGK